MKKLKLMYAALFAMLFSVTAFAHAGMAVTSSAIDAKGFLSDKYGYNDKTQLDA